MIEHMIFKGTERLDAKAINITAESCGAELNAFTDKETTCFYARFPSDQKRVVITLLSEILAAPAFREEELKKEKEVVAEEIRSNEEDPETLAVNLLFQAVYGDAPMGRPVLGNGDSLLRINRELLRHFYHTHYSSADRVVVGVGDIEHEELHQLLMEGEPPAPVRQPSGVSSLPSLSPKVLFRTRRELSQVYVCLARLAFPYSDPRRYALMVLNTALGGGVSSRLFHRLREDEGLVYSIGSFVEMYQDSGLLGIYFVAESSKFKKCLTVLREELKRLRQEHLSNEEFNRALTMTKSAIVLGAESSINRMLRLARSYLFLKKVMSVEETIAGYERVTQEEITSLITELIPDDQFYAGIVGPVKENEVEPLFD